jgi:ribonuclease Z
MTIRILGSGSATPFLGRYQSSILLSDEGKLFLFDCGEGIQMQMLRYETKFAKLNHIFISHLHGDHYLGLIGLLSSLHSWGRKNDLYLYAPPGLKEILSIQFRYQETSLNYKIVLHETDSSRAYTIFEDDKMKISTIPLEHRVPCTGFLVKEKPKLRNLIKYKLPKDILLQHIHQLKLGNDVFDTEGNLLYKADEFTTIQEKAKSFAYCTDTKYDESLVPLLQDVDLLYHEATFTEELVLRAKETFHSTAAQAATIAQLSNAQQLVIGHFSSRYKTTEKFLTEAKAVFENTFLSEEGRLFDV